MELKEVKVSVLPKEISDMTPIECMDCGFDGLIPKKFYRVFPDINNDEEYEELCKLIKKELGHESFGQTGDDKGFIITVSRCPRCNSESIFEDF
jgi:hypothetical protein